MQFRYWTCCLAVTIALQAQAQTRPLPAVLPPVVLPNVEDMAVLPAGRWVIASSMASDDVVPALYAVDTRTLQTRRVYPLQKSPRTDGGRTDAGAVGFSGHGVSYKASSRQAGTLYVVDHGAGETIDIFDVALGHSDSGAPRLTLRDRIPLPKGTVGNAVSWTPDGRIFATVTPVTGGVPQPGNVRSWTPATGWIPVPGSDVEIPAGLAVNSEGTRIFVTSFKDREVVAVSLGTGAGRREVATGFNPDNLSIAQDGSLLVGGMDGEIPDIMKACHASQSPGCTFTGHVAKIAPASFTIQCTLELGPTVTTTGTQVGRELWIGSDRSPRIWRASFASLDACPHRLDVSAPAGKR